MSRAEIKARAKQQLGGGIFTNAWLMALLMCLVASAIIAAAGSIGVAICGIIVSGPLSYGLNYIFLKQTRDGQPMVFSDLFSGFTTDFSQTFLIGLLSGVFVFLWGLLFIIPGIVKEYSYSMAFYIKADHPEYNWKQSIDASCDLMSGHKMELFILDLSFIGWYILGAPCLGIGTLWVIPYHEAARSQFYNNLVSGYVYTE